MDDEADVHDVIRQQIHRHGGRVRRRLHELNDKTFGVGYGEPAAAVRSGNRPAGYLDTLSFQVSTHSLRVRRTEGDMYQSVDRRLTRRQRKHLDELRGREVVARARRLFEVRQLHRAEIADIESLALGRVIRVDCDVRDAGKRRSRRPLGRAGFSRSKRCQNYAAAAYDMPLHL